MVVGAAPPPPTRANHGQIRADSGQRLAGWRAGWLRRTTGALGGGIGGEGRERRERGVSMRVCACGWACHRTDFWTDLWTDALPPPTAVPLRSTIAVRLACRIHARMPSRPRTTRSGPTCPSARRRLPAAPGYWPPTACPRSITRGVGKGADGQAPLHNCCIAGPWLQKAALHLPPCVLCSTPVAARRLPAGAGRAGTARDREIEVIIMYCQRDSCGCDATANKGDQDNPLPNPPNPPEPSSQSSQQIGVEYTSLSVFIAEIEQAPQLQAESPDRCESEERCKRLLTCTLHRHFIWTRQPKPLHPCPFPSGHPHPWGSAVLREALGPPVRAIATFPQNPLQFFLVAYPLCASGHP